MIKSVIGAVGGLAAAKVTLNLVTHKQILAKDEYKWDYNWDHRHPQENWTDDEKAKYTYVFRVCRKTLSDGLELSCCSF